MVADNDHPSIPGRKLAERLRDLRDGEKLTQKQVANVLGGVEPLSIATVSLWENPKSDRLPPPQRLATYARLFCTSRSFASVAPRLLRDEELDEEEREREADLHAELLMLRERAQSTEAAASRARHASDHRSSLWRFPDRTAVSVVCSDAHNPPPYAQESHLNFSRYARYADLDAIIEVFGQLRADNPASMIRILPTELLAHDFALNHVIIVGGAAVYDAWLMVHSGHSASGRRKGS